MKSMKSMISLRTLEREDLKFVHDLDNNASVMRYWFEEPFASFDELAQIYQRHLHDQNERRFIVKDEDGISVGLVELVEINHIHRSCDFQILISPAHQGRGYARQATGLAIEYAFKVLNLHRIQLYVDTENVKAVHIYESAGFKAEGVLREAFFANGAYHDVTMMSMLQHEVVL